VVLEEKQEKHSQGPSQWGGEESRKTSSDSDFSEWEGRGEKSVSVMKPIQKRSQKQMNEKKKKNNPKAGVWGTEGPGKLGRS